MWLRIVPFSSLFPDLRNVTMSGSIKFVNMQTIFVFYSLFS